MTDFVAVAVVIFVSCADASGSCGYAERVGHYPMANASQCNEFRLVMNDMKIWSTVIKIRTSCLTRQEWELAYSGTSSNSPSIGLPPIPGATPIPAPAR